jgi:flagellar protein FlgJ
MNLTDSIGLSQQQLNAAQQPAPQGTSDPKKAGAAAESFEAFFIGQYLEHMFSGIKTEGMFGGGQGEKVYRSMMMQEYGKTLAANGGLGIADTVYKSILQLQEQEQSQ